MFKNIIDNIRPHLCLICKTSCVSNGALKLHTNYNFELCINKLYFKRNHSIFHLQLHCNFSHNAEKPTLIL